MIVPEIRIGHIPKNYMNQLSDLPQWASIKQELEREATIDEKLKSVLKKCLDNEDFQNAWEKVRKDYIRFPDLVVVLGKKGSINEKFVQVPTKLCSIKILRPPEISLPTKFFPILAITNLALIIFKLSEPTEVNAFSKMLTFCTQDLINLTMPISKKKIICYQLGNVSLKIEYKKGSVKPEVNVEISTQYDGNNSIM